MDSDFLMYDMSIENYFYQYHEDNQSEDPQDLTYVEDPAAMVERILMHHHSAFEEEGSY